MSSSAQPSGVTADRTNLLQSYIPAELAKRILSAGKQIESERRLVTILFADVTGFTAMSEKLDPEVISTVLNDCFKGLISIVYKYEGVIDKFIGDEIMAIFGAPITHENDPERAVRCAKEMLEYIERFNALSPVALPVPLGLHIGMNTGTVVAGNVGSDLRMNYSVIGDTVNLASRLVHVAGNDEIVISAETYRSVSSLINVEKPKTVEIKGKSEPVSIYRVLSVKGDIEPGTRVLRESHLVGRENEMAVVKAALERVTAKKEQRLFIRGEAGVGKTRLKLELIQHARSAGITVYEGKCSSFEINTPYYLWTTLLKDILQLKADTVESETRKRVHDMLQILSMEKHEPYLATLLSLRYEEILLEVDQERKKKIFESLREFIRALSKRRPSLFVLEDVHWIDRFSQDLLRYLFTEEQLGPAMFVPLFRDEYRYSKELIEKGGTLIDLNRLTKPDSQKLMCARLNAYEVPANLGEVIYKRSEGNPFFIEELVKTLVDKKVVSVKKQRLEMMKPDFESILPETVQGVIMARIDRLEEKLKEVLYGASVIGREFDKTLLKEILKKKEAVDPSLTELLTLELILEKEEAKELAYLFKHYLIQEVAYNTILQKKRKELHKLIAQAIEKVYAEKLKDFYELLSFHYEKAEEWEKAASFLSMSGRKVEEIFSKEESKDFYERKTEAVEKLYSSGPANRPILKWIIRVFTIVYVLPICLSMTVTFPLVYLLLSKEFDTVLKWIIGTVFLLSMTAGSLIIDFIIFFGAYSLSFRKGPALYDVMEDHVLLKLANGKEYSIQYAEIMSARLQMNKGFLVSSVRSLKDMVTLKYFSRNYFLTMYLALPRSFLFNRKDAPIGASLSLSAKQGMVYLLKRSGISSLKRILLPWKILRPEEANTLGLTPTNPAEFFQQLSFAYETWRKKQGTYAYVKSGDSSVPMFTLRPQYDMRNIIANSAFSIIAIYCCSIYETFMFITVPVRFNLAIVIFMILFVVIPDVIAIWMSVSIFLARKRYGTTRFEFYTDKVKYFVGFPGVKWGELYYQDITRINYATGYFGLGTIELVTAKPVEIVPGENRRSAIYLFDLKNSLMLYERLCELIKPK